MIRVAHRFLGLVTFVFFVVWFASGVVMTFAGFPAISPREAIARAPAIEPASVRVAASSFPDAASITLFSTGARALYRVDGRLFDAATGALVDAIGEDEARILATRWAGTSVRLVERLDRADQWTPQAEAHQELPLVRYAIDDADGGELYVSLRRAMVVQHTTARSRLLAWFGAIPHWLYPIVLRRHGGAWRALVIAISALGALASLAGLVHGLRVARVRRRVRPLPVSPFRDDALRRHHLVGLAFGVVAFAWAFSGMLSFDPFGLGEGSPREHDEAVFSGGLLAANQFAPASNEALVRCGDGTKSLSLARVAGVPFYLCALAFDETRVLRADDASPPRETIEPAIVERAFCAVDSRAVVEWLDQPDAYYYPTHFDPDLSFPVARAQLANGVVAYASPRSGALVRRYDRKAAVERWLYHGVHSLDLPFLYRRPLLWRVVILALMAGGTLLAITAAIVGVRRLRRQ